MKKNIHILLAATLLFGATSCEDFLQKDPPSSPSQSVFWQKKSDFESGFGRNLFGHVLRRIFSDYALSGRIDG